MLFNTRHLFCTTMFRKLIASTKSFPSTSWTIASSSRIDQGRNFHTSGTFNVVNKHARDFGRPDWKSAIYDAEQIVEYPPSYLNMRILLHEDAAYMAPFLSKLNKGSTHPLLKIEKNFENNERRSMQAWGLIVVLFSKAAGYNIMNYMDLEKTAGVLNSQRNLADASDMVRISQLIHKGVVNIYPVDKHPDAPIQKELTLGNDIAILSGDHLLVKALDVISKMRNSKLLELMGSAVTDLINGEFIGLRDNQNQPLPSPGLTEKDWMTRSVLGSLLGKTCQGTLMLAGHQEKLQQIGYKFGLHFALAWQACVELEAFTNSADALGEMPSSLTSAPVIFTLQHDESLFEEIDKGKNSSEDIDYAKVYAAVLQGPGIGQTRELLRHHAEKALQELELLKESDARSALSNIIFAMGD